MRRGPDRFASYILPGPELWPVVGVDHLDGERKLLNDVIDEADRGGLVQPVVDPQDSDPRAVTDRGELIVLLPPRALQRSDELRRSGLGAPTGASRSASTGPTCRR